MSVAFLCHSKDCNRDVTLEFIDGAFKHLPINKYPLFITSEYQLFGVCHSILTGDGLWSERLRLALTRVPDHITNIILFLEDMIVKNCNDRILEEVIAYHIDNNNDVTKLGNHPEFDVLDTNERIGTYQILKHYNMPYLLCHQPIAIWKREFLELVVQKNLDPYQFECWASQSLADGEFGERRIYIVGEYPSYRVKVGGDYGEIIKYHHLLSRGTRIPYVGNYA